MNLLNAAIFTNVKNTRYTARYCTTMFGDSHLSKRVSHVYSRRALHDGCSQRCTYREHNMSDQDRNYLHILCSACPETQVSTKYSHTKQCSGTRA